jgi:hypothetical protein
MQQPSSEVEAFRLEDADGTVQELALPDATKQIHIQLEGTWAKFAVLPGTRTGAIAPTLVTDFLRINQNTQHSMLGLNLHGMSLYMNRGVAVTSTAQIFITR